MLFFACFVIVWKLAFFHLNEVLFFACLIFIFHHTECGVVGVLILCLSPPFKCADQVLGLFALEIRGHWSGHQGEPWTGFLETRG